MFVKQNQVFVEGVVYYILEPQSSSNHITRTQLFQDLQARARINIFLTNPFQCIEMDEKDHPFLICWNGEDGISESTKNEILKLYAELA